MTLAKHWNYNKDEDIVVTQLRGLVSSNPYVNLIPSEKSFIILIQILQRKSLLLVVVELVMNHYMEDLLERIYLMQLLVELYLLVHQQNKSWLLLKLNQIKRKVPL